jgi:6-phospho-3-hexuloisomerase
MMEAARLGLAARAGAIAAELAKVVALMPADALDPLIAEITNARRIVLHGLGREGLQMHGLAMRLFHLGLNAHVLGDMTTPPVGTGDLLIVSTGPGDLGTIASLMGIAKAAGARTVVVTANAMGGAAARADSVLLIPAQTMADDARADASLLPMGSLFELAQMHVFELLVLALRDALGETAEAMRARHTNLE